MTFGAYVQTKPDGTPFYVGKGRRERAYRLDAKSHNAHHARVVAKYGKDRVLVGFVPCSTEALSFELEKGLIKCLRRMGVGLTNCTPGGEGVSGPKSAAHIAKMSAARKGKPAPWRRGVIVSEETRKKLSAALLGKPSPRKGAKYTKEQLVAARTRAAKRWEDQTTRDKQRMAAAGQMKPVVACGVVVESINAYARLVGRPLSTVTRWVRKRWQDKIDLAYRQVVEKNHDEK